MIIVHGFVPYRLHYRERALRLFDEIAQAARAERGCLRYDVFVSVSGGSTLFLLQEWQNLDALSDHFRTAEMESLIRALPDVLDGEIQTRRFEVPEVDDLSAPQQRLVH